MREDERIARVEELSRRCERLRQELERAGYEQRAGLAVSADLGAIDHRYRDLFTKESIALVEAELAASPEPERTGRLGRLREMLVLEHVAHATRHLTDELLTREAAARLEPTSGEVVPLRRAVMTLANEGDRSRRERLAAEVARAYGELAPLHEERIAKEQAAARALGYTGLPALFDAVAGFRLGDLAEAMRGFLARTRDMYRDAMGWAVRRHLGLALEDTSRHDILALVRMRSLDAHFSAREMLEAGAKCLTELGLDLRAGGKIVLDLEPRDGKQDRAFCAPLRVPEEVVLCLAPVGGRRDWQGFLHELGLAQSYAHTSKLEPFESRVLGDASVPEAYGFLFQYLLLEAGWLKRYAKVQKPRDLLFLGALEKLMVLRRYAARLAFELEVYGLEEGREELPERYEHAMRDALGCTYPRELHLADAEPFFHGARYLRALMLEGALRKHLVHYFDEDFYRNPRCGEFLRRQWAQGRRLPAEALAKDLGCDALTPDDLERRIARDL